MARICWKSTTDAENRGIETGDWVRLASRAGETTLRAEVTDRVAPGVVYTTFHHPVPQANVVTTENSDWATNCPEYKVTAVQVAPSNGPVSYTHLDVYKRQEVSWEEAISFTAARLGKIKAEHGARALGGITSSRCTNEEAFLVQKLVRGGFGSNNVDTCARVCHSPTGYGLSQTFGTSAGTQDFDSIQDVDTFLLIGCNPTDGHPVVASQMKKRIRQGAKLIVIDPRRIDMVDSPHVKAAHHLALTPGTNVAVMTALAHVIVTEGLAAEAFIRERCDWDEYQDWARFVADPRHACLLYTSRCV